jgi:hypothetical protein
MATQHNLYTLHNSEPIECLLRDHPEINTLKGDNVFETFDHAFGHIEAKTADDSIIEMQPVEYAKYGIDNVESGNGFIVGIQANEDDSEDYGIIYLNSDTTHQYDYMMCQNNMLVDVVDVKAGKDFYLALCMDTNRVAVYGGGNNSHHQLGDNTIGIVPHKKMVEIINVPLAECCDARIAAGHKTCAFWYREPLVKGSKCHAYLIGETGATHVPGSGCVHDLYTVWPNLPPFTDIALGDQATFFLDIKQLVHCLGKSPFRYESEEDALEEEQFDQPTKVLDFGFCSSVYAYGDCVVGVKDGDRGVTIAGHLDDIILPIEPVSLNGVEVTSVTMGSKYVQIKYTSKPTLFQKSLAIEQENKQYTNTCFSNMLEITSTSRSNKRKRALEEDKDEREKKRQKRESDAESYKM